MTQQSKLPVAVRRRAQAQWHRVQNTIRMLEEVTHERLQSAYGRASLPVGADGFGTGQDPDSTIGGGVVSNPTMVAAMERIDGNQEDPVGDNVREIDHGIESALSGAGAIVRNLNGLERMAREYQGRQSELGACDACDRPVFRPPSGFCPSCTKAWERTGFPGFTEGDPGAMRRWFISTRSKWSPSTAVLDDESVG